MPTDATPGPAAIPPPGSDRLAGLSLRAIWRSSPDPVFIRDPAGRYLLVNAAYEALHGHAEGELVGHADAEFLSPEAAAREAADDARATGGSGPVVSREATLDASGRAIVRETVRSAVRDDEGTLLGVLGVVHDVTAVLETEARLADRSRMFEAMVRQSADPMALVDLATLRFAEFNEAACARLGLAREAFAQLTVPDIEAPSHRGDFQRAVERASADEPVRLVSRQRRRDGEERDVEASVRTLAIAGHAYAALVWRDVTDAMAYERILLASERRYQTLFDTASVAVLVQDGTTGEVLEANRTALARFGAASVADLTLERIFPGDAPYSLADAREFMRQALDGSPCRFEWRTVLDDGRVRWEDVTLQPVAIDGAMRVVAVAADITGRKAAELDLDFHRRHLQEMVDQRTAELAAVNRRLMLADLRLRAMFDLEQRAGTMDERSLLRHGLEEAVRLTGSKVGYVHYVNDDETIELVTWSRDTLAQCEAVFDSHYPIGRAGLWADAYRTGAPVIHNEWASTPNRRGVPEGHIALTRHMGAPVKEGGRVRMLIGVGNKELPYTEADADELTTIGTDLYGIAMRRRAELALADARDAAEAASRAKSTFLANMSHEIRTPMNAIIGLAHLLRTESHSDRQDALLGKISEAAEHLLRIINDVLDLSKIEAGKLTLEPTDFVLADVLERVRSLVGVRAGERNLQFALAVDPDVSDVLHGDGLRLGQILLNLAGNAVKFTTQGTVEIGVSRTASFRDGVRFTVRDTGIGIAPGDLARLFASFEQGDASTTRQYGGTGLGLAICKSLATIMGGRITVESAPGQGSTFTVDLPLPAAQEAALRTRHERARPRASVVARPGARVLLAEDSPVNQQVAGELLALAGAVVDIAGDGRAAVDAAALHEYDLILMDVQMPRLDGLEATRRIRRLPGRAAVPIVAMTANAFEDDRRACLEAGMDDHLAKPVDPDRLYAALERWVPARAGAAPDPSPAAEPRGSAAPGVGPTVPDDVLAALAAIPGLDVGPWLDSGPSARRNYVSLLRRFAGLHASDVATARTRLAALEPAKAARTLRTLGRVAGGLGLADVGRDAEAVEAALAGGADAGAVAGQLDALESRLAEAIAHIVAAGIEPESDLEPISP